jgi:hypothetical protein
MDIVYVLGFGSQWKNNEIRYSLRSVQKHVQDYGNIYIVGECPKWLRGPGLIHIQHPDESNFVSVNTSRKYLRACSVGALSEYFAAMNDDFFFLKPTILKEYPNYYRGEIMTDMERIKKGPYFESMKNTHGQLTRRGFNTKHFGVHKPGIINKFMLPDIIKWFNWNVRFGLLTRSLYGNVLNVKAELTTDLKMKAVTNMENFRAQVKNRDLFSVGDAILSPEFTNVMNELYPEKSRWEID